MGGDIHIERQECVGQIKTAVRKGEERKNVDGRSAEKKRAVGPHLAKQSTERLRSEYNFRTIHLRPTLGP